MCFLICCHWVSLFSVHKHWTFHSPANEAESENELDVEQQLLLLLSFVASATCLISVRRAVFVLTALFWRRSLEGGTYLCWRGLEVWAHGHAKCQAMNSNDSNNLTHFRVTPFFHLLCCPPPSPGFSISPPKNLKKPPTCLAANPAVGQMHQLLQLPRLRMLTPPS